MQRIAYAYLNLQPHQFWKLTLAEFKLMMEGFNLRNELEWRKVAQLASWVTAPHLKRPMKPDKLLGKSDNNKERKKTTPEYTKEYLDELEKDFGK